MDPRTGDVRALIGGRDYHDSQFNRAFNANRQMASTFKPFVFAAAIAAGYPPSLRLSDQPLRLNVGGKVWSPENDDGKYHDNVTMASNHFILDQGTYVLWDQTWNEVCR